MQQDFIVTVITQLGVSGIFVWLYTRIEKRIVDKDHRIIDMTDDLNDAYKKNTQASVKLEETIGKSTILTQKVYEELLRKGNNGNN